MSKLFQLVVYFLLAIIAVLPAVLNFIVFRDYNLRDSAFSILHLIVSATLIYFLIDRNSVKKGIRKLAIGIGIASNNSVLNTLKNIESEVGRNYDLLSAHILEKKITSKNQLTDTLEELVTSSYRFLDAKSAELALLDADSGLYHSALVLGLPVNSSAQAMMVDPSDFSSESRPDVMVQSITFAGSVLGSIRISLKDERHPTEADWRFLKVMALQSGLAILNTEYSKQLLKIKMSGEDSLKAKTGFLATLSHEIRGPLGVMLNAAELVLDGLCGEVNQEQVETLSMIKTNGSHLLELINDVLDYAKVESGKLVPKIEIIKAHDLMMDISKVVKAQAEVKKHKMKVYPCDEKFAFSCDRRHARQILINLLTNAIKYTPDGGFIEILAETTENNLKIRIKDNGVGIAHEDHEKVFSAFQRVDNAYSSKQIGTGLGMSLTQSLVHANFGEIGFESSLGNGSNFWISFPLEIVNADSNYVQEVELEAKGNGELILVVESEEGECKMIARYLDHIGFKAIMANNQEDAVLILKKQKIRLVIVDNRIFDTKEYHEQALFRSLKNVGTKVPVVLVSSKAFVFDIEKALKDGVDICLIKPIGLKKLGNIIDGLLNSENNPNLEKTLIEDSLSKYTK